MANIISQRDQLIATVRRNSHLAYLQMQEESARLQNAAKDAYENLSDTLLSSWSESQLKNFCDKNGISGMFHCGTIIVIYPRSQHTNSLNL